MIFFLTGLHLIIIFNMSNDLFLFQLIHYLVYLSENSDKSHL